MKKIILLTIACSQFIILNTSDALTPKQYCERLHSKRASGTNSSYELLNVDSNSTLISYVSKACLCRNDKWDALKVDSICSANSCQNNGGISAPQINGITRDITVTYQTVSSFKKECKNGDFVYKKETTKKYLGPLPANETETSSSCEGTGC